MKILNFDSFLNEKENFLNESLDEGEAYLIGDSTSILLSQTRELKNKITTIKDLSIVGIGTYAFSEILKDYRKEYPETKFIFLFMGANDLYNPTSSVMRSAEIVKEQMDRIFPNAQKFIVRAGSWGWGGLKIYGKGKNIPSEMEKYYEKVWKPLGFITIKEYLEIQYDSQGNPTHPNLEAPRIKELSREILEIAEGKREFYMEDITSARDLDSIGLDGEEKLINFYDVLQNAVHDGVTLRKMVQEGLGVFETLSHVFNPAVERAQIGLQFLGYPLSQFGVDGIFGSETEQSVMDYKSDFQVEGDPKVMDDYFFVSLINNLKDEGFGGSDIEGILGNSYDTIDSLGDRGTPSYSFSGDLGGDEYLIFVQHNQGGAGASSLVAAKEGKGKIHSFTRSKGMMNNIPGDMPDYKRQISEALNSGNDQRAASLFLEMWKIKYAAKKKEGLENINKPQNAQVKAILEQCSRESGVPFEVLVTIANIESGLNPKAGNANYKGLFALNPSTAVQYNPQLNYSNIFDPLVNAQAGSKMLAAGKDYLAKDLSRKGLLGNLDFA
jgi:hypothetical protein